MTERLILGWENIHKLFYTQEGKAIMSLSSLQQKYGPELKELGILFRWRIGVGGHVMVACWPSKLRNWWVRKQQQLYQQGKKAWEGKNYYIDK